MTYELDAGLDGVHLGDDSASGCVALSSRATVCAATGALPVTTEPTVGLPIPVTADPVAISRTGTLTVTLTAAGVAPVVRHATITVAQVLGLSWSDSGVPAKAAPGAAFVAAVRVETHGTMAGWPPLHGAVLVLLGRPTDQLDRLL